MYEQNIKTVSHAPNSILVSTTVGKACIGTKFQTKHHVMKKLGATKDNIKVPVAFLDENGKEIKRKWVFAGLRVHPLENVSK